MKLDRLYVYSASIQNHVYIENECYKINSHIVHCDFGKLYRMFLDAYASVIYKEASKLSINTTPIPLVNAYIDNFFPLIYVHSGYKDIGWVICDRPILRRERKIIKECSEECYLTLYLTIFDLIYSRDLILDPINTNNMFKYACIGEYIEQEDNLQVFSSSLSNKKFKSENITAF